MKLRFTEIRHPLLPFTLEINATLQARVTALFGNSGAGKTTLLEILVGLRRPNHGSICIDDTVLSDTATHLFIPPEKRRIGYVPQDGALFPHLSVQHNLLYGARSSKTNKGNAQNHFFTYTHVTEVLEIAALSSRNIATLSGGEKQRVALGRALLAQPRLLLLDEPLAGLEDALKERLIPYLIKVRDEFKIPMIYVTHSADEVVRLCDEVVVLDQGKITQQGAPKTVFEMSPKPRFTLRQTR